MLHGEQTNQQLLLAAIYEDQKRSLEAARALQPLAKSQDDRVAAIALTRLSAMAIRDGTPEAREYAEGGALRARAAFAPTDPHLGAALNNLAQIRRFEHRYAEAEGLYREALATWDSQPAQNAECARVQLNLAALYHERGRDTGAEELYRRAIAVLERALPPTDPVVLVARNELADVLRALGRFSESDRASRATLSAMDQAFPADDARLTRAIRNRARLLVQMRRKTEAESLLARIHE